uniref:Uncharacterized protein n=1 Tax=Anguilla anguilla TaxID=7936 RepID=A0A0E9VS12_ANGAN
MRRPRRRSEPAVMTGRSRCLW